MFNGDLEAFGCTEYQRCKSKDRFHLSTEGFFNLNFTRILQLYFLEITTSSAFI